MAIEIVMVFAVLAAGAYRLHTVRQDRGAFIMWLMLILGLATVLLVKVIPGGRVPLLVLSALFTITGLVLYARRPSTRANDTLQRPPG